MFPTQVVPDALIRFFIMSGFKKLDPTLIRVTIYALYAIKANL